jgi:hypothetical protein
MKVSHVTTRKRNEASSDSNSASDRKHGDCETDAMPSPSRTLGLALTLLLLVGASAAHFRDANSWLTRSHLNASTDIAVGATLRRIADAVRVGRDPVAAGRWWTRDGVSGPPTKYNTAAKIVKGMVNVHIVPHSRKYTSS